MRLAVHRRAAAADEVITVELRDPSGSDLPAWEPGAHVDLVLGPDLVRQYSLCGAVADRGSWLVGVLREPEGRGGSRFIFDELHEGVEIDVRGPRNNFVLEPAQRYVFIGGGIGITPMLPMIEAAAASGTPWELHYGGRTRSSMAFLDRVVEHGDAVTLYPENEVGLIDLATILSDPRPGVGVYACGPEPLLDAVEKHCTAWPSGTLHVERFSPKDFGDVTNSSFEVHLAQTGIDLVVPADVSILDAVEAAGVDVVSSCQEGTCGSCETAVLDGTVDHRDSVLTPEEQAENTTMFICVSRASCPRLVLDL
ncbi:MAG: ferredoxin [Pseudonocardia sp. SCN 72-86]|nr:MAG: ferredoxin [Pseudonocardia sp. SCN 72-86]